MAAFVTVYFILDVPKMDHSHWLEKLAKIDFLGAFTLMAAVFCLLIGLDNGGNEGWRRTYTVAPLAAAPVLFTAFVLIEAYVATHPFAPGHVIFHPSLFAAYMVNLLGMAGNVPTIFTLPLFYQAVDGLSAVASGLLLIPGSIMGVSASLGGGFYIKKTGRYYWLTVISYAVLLFSCIPMVIFTGVFPSKTGMVFSWVMSSLGGGSGENSIFHTPPPSALTSDAFLQASPQLSWP